MTLGDLVKWVDHDTQVRAVCDWIIEMGLEGGEDGGQVVVCGTPEQISECTESITGKYLNLPEKYCTE